MSGVLGKNGKKWAKRRACGWSRVKKPYIIQYNLYTKSEASNLPSGAVEQAHRAFISSLKTYYYGSDANPTLIHQSDVDPTPIRHSDTEGAAIAQY